MTGRLILAPGILDQVVGHARACLPEEACGFLVGRGDSAERFVPARNVLRSRSAFSVAPEALFELMRELRRTGQEMVGIVHSHPSDPAAPSARDMAEAHYPSAAHLIVSFAAPEPEIRAFRIRDGQAVELELHVIV